MTKEAFLGQEEVTFDNARFVIIPVPYDATSTYKKGSAKGPDALIDASYNLELYDHELDMTIGPGIIHTMSPLVAENTPEEMIESVYLNCKKTIESGRTAVVIGGEHSVALGAARAHLEKYKDLSVLHLDAHADLRDDYDNEKLSHACVMKRVSELGAGIVSVGIRSLGPEEKDPVEANQANIFYAKEIAADNEVSWVQEVIERLGENVYLTIDLDCFDPSIMPSTGTPEPGGLGWYHVIELLRSVCEERNVVGFDVCEMMPIVGLHAPDYTAAKLVQKIIGFLVKK
jgi:agmatinase